MGNRGTTYLNQRATGTLGESMQQTNANLFACTTFALDQDRDISLCDPFQFISDGLHGCSPPEDDVEWRQVQSSNGFSMVNQEYFPIEVQESQ
ncbi:hypothetical protein GCM10011585_10230 [Edaphobacter dinghuensis]|uniref:Uncharacterized protein n=1 Tax=Edaphobacter dinghuensis TaxID=1560005 RepID=A0A917H7J4_9BACT|nr:hypothetical protein GCM10011585_10230 [Edaphobacter dinghuensis]